ncbi:hypothetical protein IMW75_24615, partial [Pseudomonas gregormendelii]
MRSDMTSVHQTSPIQKTSSNDSRSERPIACELKGIDNSGLSLEKIADTTTIYTRKQARSDIQNKALRQYVTEKDSVNIRKSASQGTMVFHRGPDCTFLIVRAVALEALRQTPGVSSDSDFKKADSTLQTLFDGAKHPCPDKSLCNKTAKDVTTLINGLIEKYPAVFNCAKERNQRDYLCNGIPKSVEHRYRGKLPIEQATAFSSAGDASVADRSALDHQLDFFVGGATADDLYDYIDGDLAKLEMGRHLMEDASAKKPSRSTSVEVGVSGRDKADRGASSGNSQVVTNNIGHVDTSAAFPQVMKLAVDGILQVMADKDRITDDKDRIIADKDRKIEDALRQEIALLKELLRVRNLDSPSALNTRGLGVDTSVVATIDSPESAMQPVERTHPQQRDDNDPVVIVQTSGSGSHAVAEQPSDEALDGIVAREQNGVSVSNEDRENIPPPPPP